MSSSPDKQLPPILIHNNLLLEDPDESTNLKPRSIHFANNPSDNSAFQRTNTNESNKSSTVHNINILRSQTHYSSIDDTSVSVASFAGGGGGGGMNGGLSASGVDSTSFVDMETLLTMALETTTQKVDRENRKRQSTLLTIIGVVFIVSLCILSTVAFSEYPEDHELHSQIDTLEKDVDQLHGELNTFENDEDIDLLQRDIDDKRMFIQELENDKSIDPKEKQELVDQLQGQIDELKIEVQEVEKSKEEAGGNEGETAGSDSGGNTSR